MEAFSSYGVKVTATPYDQRTQITIVMQQYDTQTHQYGEGVEYPNGSTISGWPGKLTITCVTGDMTVVYVVVINVTEI